MDLPAAAPQQALGLYEHISGLALIQDSHVVSVHKLIHLHGSMSSRSEVMKFIEKDLMEQAGIVITRLDDKRASATYNDALPITQKEH
jgi:hypothetical protein